METDFSFGYWLKRQRLARDLRQADLAQQLGIATITLRKLEADERRPSLQLVERIATVLGLDAEERATLRRAARADLSAVALPLPNQPAPVSPPHTSLLPPPLPLQPTPFLGRETELAALSELLIGGQTYLLTISGPGGMGKTRLALALAAKPELRTLFPDGVTFVALASVGNATQLDVAVALALGLHLTSAGSSQLAPRAQILNALRPKSLLLILDNCEHLLDEVRALVGTIQTGAPGARVLATSRERLNLRGEQIFPLGGLPIGSDQAAGILFVTTATRLQPGLTLDVGQRQDVQHICAMLGGMPLALELAANWVDTLTIEQIAAEIATSGLSLLENDVVDMPERHRSMRIVVQATWQQLPADDRQVVARFAVFRGGCTRDAAEHITGATLPQLTATVRKSILQHSPDADRYTMHELLRQYAAEQLADDPEQSQAVADRHAAYYLQFLAAHAKVLQGRAHVAALMALNRERLNISAAWAQAVGRPLLSLVSAASDVLGSFYEWQGYLQEGEAAFSVGAQLAERLADELGPAGLRLRAWYAVFCAFAGKLDEARAVLERVLAVCERGGAEHAFALWRLGRIVALQGGDGVAHYQESLHLYHALRREWEISSVLADLGEAYRLQGDHTQATQVVAEGRALCEQRGDVRGLSQILDVSSQVAIEVGALEEAEHLAYRSYELAQTLGYRSRAAGALGRLGLVLMHRGRYAESVTYLERSLAAYQEIGDALMTALAYSRLALALLHGGDDEAARRHAATSVILARPHGGWILAQALLVFAFTNDGTDLVAADAALSEGIALCRAQGLATHLCQLLVEQSGVAWDRGDERRARACAAESLRMGVEQHTLLTVAMSFSACVMPLIAEGQAQLAAKLYALDDQTYWGSSSYIGPFRERLLAALRAALPPEVLDAILECEAGYEPWETAADLLVYIDTAGW